MLPSNPFNPGAPWNPLSPAKPSRPGSPLNPVKKCYETCYVLVVNNMLSENTFCAF